MCGRSPAHPDRNVRMRFVSLSIIAHQLGFGVSASIRQDAPSGSGASTIGRKWIMRTLGWLRSTAASAVVAVAALGVLGGGQAAAQGKQLTLCWAAWDPANALVELGKDFTKQSLSLIHISEPTRLLSISYAVFCLKKKK